ncbi:hypothetical protein BKA66DRAFT_428405 [Pyrenochaeta sp. MPI-SDFR-AT-0127]|nr:hypothetical protein BKA66DRAFT_428405 [Pyrenochaeta sp. MPI-SDFR-AT-0127]
MHRLSRVPLANLVCPSAPFLAPRLLRATVPVAAQSLQCSLQQSCYATTEKGKGKERSQKPFRTNKHSYKPMRATKEATAPLLNQLRQASDTRNVQKVMGLYPTLLAAQVLTPSDTRRITQTLHVRARHASANSRRSELLPFAQRVASDLRSGVLQPHYFAFVHLFGIFKECKCFDEGRNLWQWLVEQDDRYVSQAAYGAVIELLAYGGAVSLPDLENMYADGLKRFPGTFAEYHLSPDAIIPDRTRPFEVAGIPIILLQGILTARILSRDWKKAYLALDTALRLLPTQTPSRYFELFMTERPVSEAYTAFLVACRAGICLKPNHVTALIMKMRAAMRASPSMADRMMLVRAIANALYAYLQAGGQLESIHVGNFIHAIVQLLPEKMAGEDYESEAAEIRNTVVVATHEIMSGLIQAGMSPQIPPFEGLISLSGKLRVSGLLSTTLQDVQTAGLDLGPIGTRSALTSAGLVGDRDIIEQLWERMVSTAEAETAQIPFEDWITFTKACRRANHTDYFRGQLLKLPHAITSSTERHIIQQIDQQEPTPSGPSTFDYMAPEEVASQFEALKAQMKNIEAVVMSGQPLDLLKSPFYMHIDPDYAPLGQPSDLRAIYNELTTDPHQPPPPPPAEGAPVQTAASPTGIPLDELRFQNWVTVLEMMDDAEVVESDLQIALNAAIKTGNPMKTTPAVPRLRKEKSEPIRSAGSLRLRVKGLRASKPADVPIYRMVDSKDSGEKHKPMAHHASDGRWVTKKIRKFPTS